MKTYWGVEVQHHAFLNLALEGGEWLASCPSHFTPRERPPSTYWIGGWMGPSANLDLAEKKVPSSHQDLGPKQNQ